MIDDNADTLALQEIVLGQAGYDVYTAECGEKAIQILSEIDQPNLILLDMQLGDMSGIELLLMLEKRKPEIIQQVPIVFLTAMSEVPVTKAIGLIQKPADTDVLLKAISHFIELGRHAPYIH